MIRPEDDLLHRAAPGFDDPYWNESAWFGFTVPERTLTGWFYFYHRPNMNYTVGGVALWDPSGENQADCLYYDWGTPIATPPGSEMYDFTLDTGLSVRCRKPLESFELELHNADIDVELTWDAVTEPQTAHTGDMPAGANEFGKGHYNQAGRMRGTIRLPGDDLDIDCFYGRDHSWGPRRITTNPRGDFASAVASEQSGFLAMSVSNQPMATDPCVGVHDPVLFGWYLRDGKPSRLGDAHRTVTERGADGRPLKVEIHGTDDDGRELHALGTCRNTLKWYGYPFMYMYWAYTDWEFDGQVVAGEEQDYFPIQGARRMLRH
jgi:hypothetical protein